MAGKQLQHTLIKSHPAPALCLLPGSCSQQAPSAHTAECRSHLFPARCSVAAPRAAWESLPSHPIIGSRVGGGGRGEAHGGWPFCVSVPGNLWIPQGGELTNPFTQTGSTPEVELPVCSTCHWQHSPACWVRWRGACQPRETGVPQPQ